MPASSIVIIYAAIVPDALGDVVTEARVWVMLAAGFLSLNGKDESIETSNGKPDEEFKALLPTSMLAGKLIVLTEHLHGLPGIAVISASAVQAEANWSVVFRVDAPDGGWGSLNRILYATSLPAKGGLAVSVFPNRWPSTDCAAFQIDGTNGANPLTLEKAIRHVFSVDDASNAADVESSFDGNDDALETL